MPAKTIIEPFRIKSVEPIRWTTRQERQALLEAAHYNLFLLPADDVTLSLIPDGDHRLSRPQDLDMLLRAVGEMVQRAG